MPPTLFSTYSDASEDPRQPLLNLSREEKKDVQGDEDVLERTFNPGACFIDYLLDVRGWEKMLTLQIPKDKRPKMKPLQKQVQKNVENMMSGYFQVKTNIPRLSMRTSSEVCFTKPSFIASCSTFGPELSVVLLLVNRIVYCLCLAQAIFPWFS
uniref:Uncharacterized protein n=1 Tax=Chenopodium quinoa TaxID=63459 RepID=A0A803MZR9_CHEQI